MAYACPKCASADLAVQSTAWVLVDNSALFGNPEWNGTSQMQCRDCGHDALARDFAAKPIDKAKVTEDLRDMLANTENRVYERALRNALRLLEGK